MPAEIGFSGGATLEIPEEDAETLVGRIGRGQAIEIPAGWLAVKTRDGVVAINTAQVAYVRDTRERSKAPQFP